MARIALDSRSHQAIREEGTEATHYGVAPRADEWRGRRLSGLRSDLDSLGDSLDIVDLENDDLTDATVLIIAGRHDCASFTETELDRIARFSQTGGGIVLMANHPPGFVSPQNRVCQRLELPVMFQMHDGTTGRCSLRPHETSRDCEEIEIRTSCGISVSASPLATAIVGETDGSSGAVAVAIESGTDHARIVAIGSAGHIASYDDSRSDLYASASNARWTLNIIDWLRGETETDAKSLGHVL